MRIRSLALLVVSALGLMLSAKCGPALSSDTLSVAASSTLPAGMESIPQLPDWGQPTAGEQPDMTQWPTLPSGQGWARHLGQSHTDVLAVGGGVVVCGGMQSEPTTAYRLTDGARLWTESGVDIRCWLPSPGICGGALIGSGGRGVQAFDLHTGRRLWDFSGVKPIAVCTSGAWVTRIVEHQGPIEQPDDELSLGLCQDLLLLDGQTGKVVQDFKLGKLFGAVGLLAPDNQQMAVVTAQELVVCSAAGIVARRARPHPGWQSQLALDARGVLEIGHPAAPPYAELRRQFDERPQFKTQAAWDTFYNQTAYGKAMNVAAVEYYALPGLALKWSGAPYKSPDKLGGSGATLEPALTPQLALGVGYNTAIARRRDSGAPVTSPLPRGARMRYEMRPGMIVATANDYVAGKASDDTPITEPTQVLNLGSGQTGSLPPPPSNRAEWLRAGDGYACWLDQSALVCLKADDLLQPLPGHLQLLDSPVAGGDVVADLQASPDPLVDNTLMRRMANADQPTLDRLISGVTEFKPPQLAAVVQAINFRLAWRIGDMRQEPQLAARLETLDPSREPEIVDVLRDRALEWVRPALEHALFHSRGAAAREYIKRTYALQDQQPLQPAGPPWALREDQSYLFILRKELKPGEYDQLQWVRQPAPGGGTYSAFTGFAATDMSDVLLGFDADGDGKFDWIVPTGIVDRCEPPRGFGLRVIEPRSFVDGKRLQLAMNLPELTIGHHQPRYGPPDQYGRAELSGADYSQTKLKLDDLTRDSDGDGLTDITEQMLLLDPHNPDTDGDGIPDGIDPAPNANPARMGKLERGLARLMQAQDRQQHWDELLYGLPAQAEPQLPFSAVFVDVTGLAPLACSYRGQRTIYVTRSDQLWQASAPDSLLPRYTDLFAGTVDKQELGEDKIPAGGLAVRIQGTGGDVILPPDVLVEIDGELYPAPQDY